MSALVAYYPSAVPIVTFDAEAILHGIQRVHGTVPGRVGITIVVGASLDSKVGVVVVEGRYGIASRHVVGGTVALAIGHLGADTHERMHPYGSTIEKLDTAIDSLGPEALVRRCLEVEEGMCALDGEELQLCSIEQLHVSLVAMASHVVVAVDLTTLDVYLDVGPLGEGLLHRLGIGDVEDVVEGILRAIHDVQSLAQALARLGALDKVIAHAATHVEGSILGNVAIYEYEERVETFGIDTCGVTHI